MLDTPLKEGYGISSVQGLYILLALMEFPMRKSCFLIGLLLFSAVASAQESRGSITGKITDPQGASIPGATVIVTNIETNQLNRTKSNETGYFEVTFLNPGRYQVTVESTGFRKLVRSGLVLPVAGRLDVQMQLELGTLAETVEVSAEAALL